MRAVPGTFAKAAPPRAVLRKSQSVVVTPTRSATAPRPRAPAESAAAAAPPPPPSAAPPTANVPDVVASAAPAPELPTSKPVQPSDAVTVVCRVRPLGTPSPEGSPTVGCTQVDHDSTGLTIVPDGEVFTFDRIFKAGSTQQEVFDAIGAPVLQTILDGFNGCVLAYGQTASGKTHTIYGPPELERLLASRKTAAAPVAPSDVDQSPDVGLMYRLVRGLFAGMAAAGPEKTFSLACQYIEIYKEGLRDLLDEDKATSSPDAEAALVIEAAIRGHLLRKKLAAGQLGPSASPRKDAGGDAGDGPKLLQIREDPMQGVFVAGATMRPVSSPADVYDALAIGAVNRSTASTLMNARSSRSHTVFQLYVTQNRHDSMTTLRSTLTIVDLAGSERVDKTGATGQRLEEAKKILYSLHALGNVINALTDGKSSHVPYRDSKLTRLLQESLGGNARTVLVLACSPAESNRDETLGTMRFGRQAKRIANKPKVNMDRPAAELATLLAQREVELARLRAQLAKYAEASAAVGGASGTVCARCGGNGPEDGAGTAAAPGDPSIALQTQRGEDEALAQAATLHLEQAAVMRERDEALSQLAQLQASVASLRASKEELSLQFETARATAIDAEAAAAAAKRDAVASRVRVEAILKDAEASSAQRAATLKMLQESNASLQATVATHEGTIASLRAKLLEATQPAAPSDADHQAQLDAAHAERDSALGRVRVAEQRAIECDAQIAALKDQLADAQQATEAAAQAAAARPASVASSSAAAIAEVEAAAMIASLRRKIAALTSEHEACEDALASLVPLPSFVGSGQASQTAPAASPGRGTLAASDATSAAPAADKQTSSLLTQLRAVMAERPMLCDALTDQDLQLRSQRAELARLTAILGTSRQAEATLEASAAALRRQIDVLRAELAATGEALALSGNAIAAAQERASRAESEKYRVAAELQLSKVELAEKARLHEAAAAELAEAISAVARERDASGVLSSRLAAALAATADAQAALTAAAQATESLKDQVAALSQRAATAEANLAAAQSDTATLAAARAELERAHAAEQARVSLAAKEEAGRSAALEAALRETEASLASSYSLVESLRGERDAATARSESLGSEIAALRARMGDFEADRATITRENAQALAALRERLGSAEAARDACRVDLSAAEARAQAMRQQFRADMDAATAAAAREKSELERNLLQQSEAAVASANRDSASIIASLKADLESSASEVASLSERCRALQRQASALAGEVRVALDQSRTWQDEALRAKAAQAAESEASVVLSRSLVAQLESVKADFYSFLTVFGQGGPDAEEGRSRSAAAVAAAAALAERLPSMAVLPPTPTSTTRDPGLAVNTETGGAEGSAIISPPRTQGGAAEALPDKIASALTTLASRLDRVRGSPADSSPSKLAGVVAAASRAAAASNASV